jgi:hypothetical protein
VGRVDDTQMFAADTLKGTTLHKAQKKLELEQNLTTLRKHAGDQLQTLPSIPVNPSFKLHTDLLGTLEVASDELGKSAPGESAMIYYFGDMRESMEAPRRDFDRRPPRDRAEAEQWADADAAAVPRQMSIDTARFHNAEIRVLMGNLAAKPKASEVRAYWERLFKNVGFDPAKIRFN